MSLAVETRGGRNGQDISHGGFREHLADRNSTYHGHVLLDQMYVRMRQRDIRWSDAAANMREYPTRWKLYVYAPICASNTYPHRYNLHRRIKLEPWWLPIDSNRIVLVCVHSPPCVIIPDGNHDHHLCLPNEFQKHCDCRMVNLNSSSR